MGIQLTDKTNSEYVVSTTIKLESLENIMKKTLGYSTVFKHEIVTETPEKDKVVKVSFKVQKKDTIKFLGILNLELNLGEFIVKATSYRYVPSKPYKIRSLPGTPRKDKNNIMVEIYKKNTPGNKLRVQVEHTREMLDIVTYILLFEKEDINYIYNDLSVGASTLMDGFAGLNIIQRAYLNKSCSKDHKLKAKIEALKDSISELTENFSTDFVLGNVIRGRMSRVTSDIKEMFK